MELDNQMFHFRSSLSWMAHCLRTRGKTMKLDNQEFIGYRPSIAWPGDTLILYTLEDAVVYGFPRTSKSIFEQVDTELYISSYVTR